MSFADNFKKFFATTEAEVLSVIVKIRHGIEFAEHEVQAGFSWLNQHASDITGAVNTVAGVVGSLAAAGVNIPPAVSQAVIDANKAVAALNAAASLAEKGTPQALIDGYVAAKLAWKAADGAAVALATAPTA